MHNDFANAPRFLEPHIRPGRAGVAGLVHAVAHDVGVANGPRFAGPRPHHARVRRCHRECANGLRRLIVKDGLKRARAVGGLPHATGCRTEVVRHGITGDTRHRGDAPTVVGSHVVEARRLHRLCATTTAAPTAALRERGNGDDRRENERRHHTHTRESTHQIALEGAIQLVEQRQGMYGIVINAARARSRWLRARAPLAPAVRYLGQSQPKIPAVNSA